MEKRRHPRIQLPLLVELQHPSIGRQDCVARDISEGGVFVELESPKIHVGATVKLTLKSPNTVDSQPTPTVTMEVRRVEEDGLGMAFVNRTSRHLWESVERLRDELAVGRDYFQIHVSGLVIREDGRLLVVQQSGRWTFPGTYLVVGDHWQRALSAMLTRRFSLEVPEKVLMVRAMHTESAMALPEAAVARLFALAPAAAGTFRFEPGDRYRECRWLANERKANELTFVDEVTRQEALAALNWARDNGHPT
jgi:hypothetical protein